MKIERLSGGFRASLSSVLGQEVLSESAAGTPIKLKYLGHDLKLDGNDEWKIELEPGDVYEFVPAKTARNQPVVIFREGREKIELKCSMPVLLQLLCGTHFPRGRSKENFMYMTEVRQRRTRLYTASDCVLSNKWKVSGSVGMYQDAAGALYLEFNLLTPLQKLLKPTPLQKLRVAFKQADQQRGEPSDKGASAKAVPAKESTPVADAKVGANGADVPERTAPQTKYIAAIESKMHHGNVWVTVSPTAVGAKSAGMVMARDARVSADRDSDAKVSIYKVASNAKVMRSAKNAPSCTMVSTALLKESGSFVRSFPVLETTPPRDIDPHTERPSSEIDISGLNVSWSNYDMDKVNLVLARLFNDGFFSQWKPRATTKGLVFDFMYKNDPARSRKEIIGAARRVYQYLHGTLGLEVKPIARFGTSAALLRFEFKPLSAEESESIKLLMAKPPLLEAPIYTLDTQSHMTFAVESFNKNTGTVTMWPVRDGHRIGRRPTVVLYTRLRKFNSEA